MIKSRKSAFVAVLAGLSVLMVAGAVYAATASARRATVGGRSTGEVLIGNRVVVRYRADAGGYSSYERARITADRLNNVFRRDDDPDQFVVRRTSVGPGVYAGERLIAVATAADADANNTSASRLASEWRNNIVTSLGGTVRDGDRDRDNGSGYASWEGADTKWVPILDVGNRGVRIGAAQVAGPRVQVDKTRAVAKLDLDFRDFARIDVYVPISSLNVIDLDRVQGVSVWAIGDLEIVDF